MTKKALTLCVLALGFTVPCGAQKTPDPAKAANIILYIGDGMSWGQIQLARDYMRTKGKSLNMEKVMNSGHTGYCTLNPLGSLVPESGASASAIATGFKVANRAVSQLPDGTKLETILELARKHDRAVGLVTTARVTHATPAAFLTHSAKRDDENEIAEQIIEFAPDVILGGGRKYFLQSLLEKAKQKGYTLIRSTQELEGSLPEKGKILGLFADNYFPYVLDRGKEGVPSVPSLPQMTEAALMVLKKSPGGFVLVVDGRLIDEASHNNDAGSVLAETLEFDEAIGLGIEFLRTRAQKDTQIIVTSNHDTGGMGLVYRANPMEWGGQIHLNRIAGQKASFRWMLGKLWRRQRKGERLEASSVQNVLGSYLAPDIRIEKSEAEFILEALSLGPKSSPFSHSPALNAIGRALQEEYFIRWNTGTHTNSPVPVFGIGPNTEKLKGMIENTQVFNVMMEALTHQ